MIESSFVRAFDDNIVLKGFEIWRGRPTEMRPLHDIAVRHCVLWNDWGRALEIGAETRAAAIHDIVFADVTVAGHHAPISRLHGYDAEHPVRRIRFNRLTIQGQHVESLTEGNIVTNAYVKDITFT